MVESFLRDDLSRMFLALPGDKLVQLYHFSWSLSDAKARQKIQHAMRPSLRSVRVSRVFSPLRIYCLPFQSALCSSPSRKRPMGRIPRSVLVHMWGRLVEHSSNPDLLTRVDTARRLPAELDAEVANHPLFPEALEATARVRQRTHTDEEFRHSGNRIHPGFWEILSEMEDIVSMRHELAAARSRLGTLGREALRAGQAESTLALLGQAAGQSRRRKTLFLLTLAGNKRHAARVLDICRTMNDADGPAIFSDVARVIVEDCQDLLNALDHDGSAEHPLHGFIDQSDELGQRISELMGACPDRRDVRDLHAAFVKTLRTRTARAAEEFAERLRPGSEGGDLLPGDYMANLGALVRSQPLFIRFGLKSFHRQKTGEIIKAAKVALDRSGRRAMEHAAPERMLVLDSVLGSAHLFEPLLGTSDTLGMLRASFEQLAGERPPDEPADLLVGLVELRLRLSGTPAPSIGG